MQTVLCQVEIESLYRQILINFNLESVNFQFSFRVLCHSHKTIFNSPPPQAFGEEYFGFSRVDANSDNPLGVHKLVHAVCRTPNWDVQ